AIVFLPTSRSGASKQTSKREATAMSTSGTSAEQPSSQPLWEPSKEQIAEANMTAFMAWISERESLELVDFASFYGWSVDQSETFWRAFWEWSESIGDGAGAVTSQDADKTPGATYFVDASIKFAENLRRRRDDSVAIVVRAEEKVERRLSHREHYATVARLAQALR